MATAIDTGARVFTIGNVLGRTFGVMGGAGLTVFGLSFLLGGVPQAIWSMVMPSLMVGVADGLGAGAITLMVVGGLIMLALSLVVQGALVKVVIGHSEGRSVPIAQAVATGFSMILPLLGLAVLSGLGVALGFLLLVIPGMILLIMWIVAAPALVDERLGVIAALSRSRALTKGARWKIFGLLLVVFVVAMIVSIIVGLLAAGAGMDSATLAAAGQAPSVTALLVGLLINTLIYGFWSAMISSLFVELRNWKDGLNPGNLEEVFS